jgi:hypothetical protein
MASIFPTSAAQATVESQSGRCDVVTGAGPGIDLHADVSGMDSAKFHDAPTSGEVTGHISMCVDATGDAVYQLKRCNVFGVTSGEGSSALTTTGFP